MSETEWDALQRRLGSAPRMPPAVLRVTEDHMESIAVAAAEAHKEEKDGEDEDEEDREAFESYRRQRLEELREGAPFGRTVAVNAASWKAEITDASMDGRFVVVMLHEGGMAAELLQAIFGTLAVKFRMCKFVVGRASLCMAKTPATASLPLLLVYHNGTVAHQEMGLAHLGGLRATPDDVEWLLHTVGAVPSTLTEPPSTTTQGRVVLHIEKKHPSGSADC